MSRIVSRGAVGLVTCICICWAVTTAVGESSGKTSSTEAPDQVLNALPAEFTQSDAFGDVGSLRTSAVLPPAIPSVIDAVPVGGPPVPHGTCPGGQEISQLSDNNTVTAGNSVFCPGCAGACSSEQSWARCFPTGDFPANLVFQITCVRFGIQTCSTPSLVPIDVTLKLTIVPAGGPDCGSVSANDPTAWTPDHTQVVSLAGDASLNGTVEEVLLTSTLDVPIGSGVLFEVMVPDQDALADGAFIVGGNGSVQSADPYLWAGGSPGCGITLYTEPANIDPPPGGFPDAKFVMTLIGVPLGANDGACCQTDGTCAVVDPALCTGTFQGPDTACDPGACLGACCRIDGSCTDGSEDACAVCNPQPGVFQGHGTACSDPIVCDDNCDVSNCPGGITDELLETPCIVGVRGNDGCNQTPAAFEDIFCDTTVCGQYWYDGAGMTRDTDWWRLVLADNTVVSITVEGTYGSLYGLIESDPLGSPDCADGTGFVNPAVVTAYTPCETPTVETVCLPAGTHYIFVAPDFPSDPTCTLPCAPYQLTVTCQSPCSILDSCAPGSTGQPANNMGNGAGGTLAGTSDQDGGFQIADNMVSLENGFITSVRWWGINLDFGTVTGCQDDPLLVDGFQIVFYNNDAGGSIPGTVKAGPISVAEPGTLTKQFTGRILPAGTNVLEVVYDADISGTPVAVSEGECLWMSVVNNTVGTPNCAWLWQTAPPGDGFPNAFGSAQTAAPPVPAVYGLGDISDYDLGWCVDIVTGGAGCLPPDVEGACCDPCAGTCTNVLSGAQDCTGPNDIFTPADPNQFPTPFCDQTQVPPCNLVQGACCNTTNGSCINATPCTCLPGQIFSPGLNCPGFGQPEVECEALGACCLFACPFTCVPDISATACTALGGFRVWLGGGILCQPPDQNQCGGTPPEGCEGDANQDGVRDGKDIQTEITAMLLGGTGMIGDCSLADTPEQYAAMDTNNDGNVNAADADSFAAFLIEGKACVAPEICAPCPNPPDPADQYESEICGDDDNGGCNSTPNVYEDILDPCTAGWTFCGTAWAEGATRDTDWWRFTLPQATDVTATLRADIPIVSFFINVTDCGNLSTQGLMFSEACSDDAAATMTETLCAGTWVVFFGTGDSGGGAVFDGFPCPNDAEDNSNAYTASLSCAAPVSGACCNGLACSVVPSSCDCSGVFFPGEACFPGDPQGHVCELAANDECTGAIVLTCDGTPDTMNLLEATTVAGDPVNPCYAAAGPVDCNVADNNVGTLWYIFEATATSAVVTTCNNSSAGGDTVIAVYDASPGCAAMTCENDFIDCNEDAACGVTGFMSEICATGLTIGNDYFIVIEAFDEVGRGEGTTEVSVTCPCAPSAPGDDCGDPIDLGTLSCGVPLSDSQAPEDFAQDDANDPDSSCEIAGGGPFGKQASWYYTFTAPAGTNTVTVSTCASAATQDCVISVYDDCALSPELACDDDFCTAPAFGPSLLTFSATGGNSYIVLIDVYSGGATDPTVDINTTISCP